MARIALTPRPGSADVLSMASPLDRPSSLQFYVGEPLRLGGSGAHTPVTRRPCPHEGEWRIEASPAELVEATATFAGTASAPNALVPASSAPSTRRTLPDTPLVVERPTEAPPALASPSSPSSEPGTVWNRLKSRCVPIVLLFGIEGFVNAGEGIAHWPLWLMLCTPPILVAAIVSMRTESMRVAIRAALLAGAAVAVIAGTFLLMSGVSGARRSGLRLRPKLPTPAWSFVDLGRDAIRAVVSDGTDVWAVTHAATLLELDGASAAQLGPVRHFGSHIEHVTTCEGEVLVTYDDGSLAAFADSGAGPIKRIIYGHPVYDGNATGTMACGGGSLFVAMPLEAEVVRIVLPNLRIIARIQGIARVISGVAFNNGMLYVEDPRQAAVIAVDLTNDLPTHWTVTMPEPGAILPLGSSEAMLTRQRSRCLGHFAPTDRQELGLAWSPTTPVRLAAIGGGHGFLVDAAGWVYRFNLATGEIDAAPVRVPGAVRATSIAATTSGELLLAVPDAHRLIALAPRVWVPTSRVIRPAPLCLPPAA